MLGFSCKLKKSLFAKVCSFLKHSCLILRWFRIVVIFDIKSAEMKTKSADVILKITIILHWLKIAQHCSKNGRTLMFTYIVLSIYVCLQAYIQKPLWRTYIIQKVWVIVRAVGMSENLGVLGKGIFKTCNILPFSRSGKKWGQ